MAQQPQEVLTEAEIAEQYSEQVRIRRQKLADLKAADKDPFQITSFDRTAYAGDIINQFEQMDGSEVRIAGRIMSWRDMGKANFIDVLDGTGRIQVM